MVKILRKPYLALQDIEKEDEKCLRQFLQPCLNRRRKTTKKQLILTNDGGKWYVKNIYNLPLPTKSFVTANNPKKKETE